MLLVHNSLLEKKKIICNNVQWLILHDFQYFNFFSSTKINLDDT